MNVKKGRNGRKCTVVLFEHLKKKVDGTHGRKGRIFPSFPSNILFEYLKHNFIIIINFFVYDGKQMDERDESPPSNIPFEYLKK